MEKRTVKAYVPKVSRTVHEFVDCYAWSTLSARYLQSARLVETGGILLRFGLLSLVPWICDFFPK